MKRISKILALFGLVLIPTSSHASESAYTWLMNIGPLHRLQETYGPGSNAPLLDLEHCSVDALAHAFVAALILLLLAFIGARRIRNRKAGEGLIPDEKLTMKNVWELSIGALYGLVEELLGEKEARKYFPFLGTLFIYIFICNLIGLIPGFIPPTANISINASMSICVFLYYHFAGIREHGPGYIKQFMGPILLLAPLMLVIEIISHFVRVLSLSVRLFGNIHGDHLVLEIFTDLTKLFIPVIFLGLGLFISFIQAFVFTLLSSIYFQLSLSHEH